MDALLIKRLQEILTRLEGIHLVPQSLGGEQITRRMREVRVASLGERKAVYEVGRINDQRDWYASQAQWNKKRAVLWDRVLFGIEVCGVVAAVLKVIGVIEVDLLGFAGTMAAASTSWLETKQHVTLAESYAIAAQELAVIKGRGSTPRNRGHAATSVGGALARLRRAAHARPTSSV